MAEAGRESGIYGRFLDQARGDEALTQLAVKQHAVFALDQARARASERDADNIPCTTVARTRSTWPA